MFTYFFMIFEVHHTIFRDDVCFEEIHGSIARTSNWHYIRRYKTYEKDEEKRE